MHHYTYYGSYLKLDSASYESSHKVLTKGIYNKTSRQRNVFHNEMLSKIIVHEIHQQYSFIGNALSLSFEDHLKLFNNPILTEIITFTLISNLPYYKLNHEQRTEVHYVIQYMKESIRNISEVKDSPFKLYIWEYMEGGNLTTNSIFKIDVITQDSINGQAYIFPFFDRHNCPRNHYATTDHLFWLNILIEVVGRILQKTLLMLLEIY